MESSALVYILLTLITVGLAFFVKNREYVPLALKARYGAERDWNTPYCSGGGLNREQARNLVAEFAVYCLLAGVSACRIAVGNDYWVYRFNFRLIMQERHVSSEMGFNFVVRCIQSLFGYDHYLPVFGFFSLVTVYFFVRALHDQGQEYAFSLFLLMTGGYYFNSLNSVRYYLALAVALFSMKYVLRREFGKFILWILFGAIFHKSVLLVIPVYLAAYFFAKTKFRKWYLPVIGIFLASLIFCQDLYRFVIFKIYPFYENTGFDNGRISYVNVAKCLGTFGLAAIVFFQNRYVGQRTGGTLTGQHRVRDGFWSSVRQPVKGEKLALRFYLVLNVFGLIAFCCGSFVPEVTRIGYYMIISQIFLLPMLVARMKKGWLKSLCKWGVILAFSGYFVLLLREMYRVDIRLLPYLNWIFN